MPKHMGWRGRKFYIGDMKMAEISVSKARKVTRVIVRRFERSTSGAVMDVRKTVKKFPTNYQASRFVQDTKTDISKAYRKWIRPGG